MGSPSIIRKFSYGGSFFTYNLDTEDFSEKNLENILGNGILSTHNSIINTPEENVIIYSYLNTENRLVLQKIKLLADGIQIIQTMKEETKSLAMNSCKCKFIRKSTNFIECLTLDEEKIFTRFYRADKSRNRDANRYGLGLAIAKNIVTNHNGTIKAYSKDGKTTFKILLKK